MDKQYQTDKQQPISVKLLAHIVSLLLIFQPVLISAQPVVNNDNGGNATAGESANDVPVVNISTPSAAGVSHNTYDSFNVDRQGLILNNSASAAQSQLGGTVNRNTNLQAGREANIILNEVTQANRSQLNGYTEIAGQQADLIIANPYGITCDGCGFINTPNATLTTGKPIFNNGRIQRYSVDQGDVLFKGLGLNATNVNHFKVISRATVINAEVNANNLSFILGRNDVDYNSNTATAKADNASTKPQFALDASTLGGMYANQITLVGTEAGVGVNVDATMATDASDLRMTVDGDISLSQTQSARDLHITSNNGDIELNDSTYAVNNLNLQANTITNNDIAGAQNNVTINADSLNQNGTLVAGLNADYSINNSGDLSVTVTDTFNNNSTTIAGDQLTINGGTLNNTALLDATDLIIQNQAINNSDKLDAVNNITINTTTLNNNNGEIEAGNRYSITTDTLSNDGGEINNAGTDASQITATTELNNNNGVIRSNSDNLTIETNTLNNQEGTIAHGGAAITSVFNLNIETADNRAGFIGTNGRLNLTGFTAIDNSLLAGSSIVSTIVADHLEISGGSINNNGGKLFATGTDSANITTDSFSNDGGNIFSVGNLNLDSDTLSNSGGQVQSASNIVLDLLEWDLNDIDSVINATNHLTINLQGDLTHNAGNSLIANDDLTINTDGNIFNSGTISTGNDFIFTGTNLTNNSGARLSAGNNFTLDIVDSLINNGILVAQNTLDISAGSLTNTELVGAGDTLNITTTTGDVINDGGRLFSNNLLTINTDNRVQNLQGTIFAVNDLTITGNTNTRATELLNSSGNIESLNTDVNLNVNSINNRRTVFNPDFRTRTAGAGTTEQGTIFAGRDINIDAQSLRNEVSAIAANRDVNLDVQFSVINRGYEFGGGLTNLVRGTDAAEYPHFHSMAGSSFHLGTRRIAGENFDIVSGNDFASTLQFWMGSGDVTTNELIFQHTTSTWRNCGSPSGFCTNRNTSLVRVTPTTVQRSRNTLNEAFNSYTVISDFTFILNGTQTNSLLSGGFNNVSAGSITSTGNTDRYAGLSPDTIFPSKFEGSTIFAGRTVDIQGNANVSNGSGSASGVRGGPASLNPRGEDTSATSTGLNSVDTGEPVGNYVYNPTNNFTPPSSGSLFAVNNDPQQNYLIVTDPNLTDLGFFNSIENFLGTDEILDLLPEDPEVTTRRLGDAYYETQLVRQAVLETTGLRYVDESINNDAEQVQYLVNNAIAVREDLQLSVGVALSADQIAQLTHDIIWLVEEEVQGQTVLVPVYYASALRHGDMNSNGALIMADNVQMNLGQGGLVNMGTISANDVVDIEAAQNILNNGGIVNARERVSLTAGSGLQNIRGRVTTSDNGSILLVARSGSVNNTRGSIAGGNIDVEADEGGLNNTAGNIDAASTLDIDVDGDILNNATQDQDATIRTGGDASIVSNEGSLISEAHRDRYTREATSSSITSTKTPSNIKDQLARFAQRKPLQTNNNSQTAEQLGLQTSERYQNSTIDIKGNLTTDIGNNIKLEDGTFNVDGDATLAADNNIIVEGSFEQSIFAQGNEQRSNRTVQEMDLSVGGDFVLSSGNDIKLTATNINSDGDVSLIANSVFLNAAENRTTSRNSYGRTHTANRTTTHETSDITSGGTLMISARGDVIVQGSQLQTVQDMIINAQGEIDLQAVYDEEYSYHKHTKKRSWGRKKTTTEEHLSLTSQGSSLDVGGNLLMNIGVDADGNIEKLNSGKITFDGSNVNVKGEAVVYSDDDVNVYAAQDYEMHRREVKKRGALGLSKSNKGSITHQQTLQASDLITQEGDLSLLSDNNINVIASNLDSGGDINLQAYNDVIISAAQQTTQVTEWDESSRYLSGGDFFRQDEVRDGSTTNEFIAASVFAQNNINIEAGSARVVGSDLVAGNDINATTDVGDIEVVAAASSEQSTHYERHLSSSFSDIIEGMVDPSAIGDSLEAMEDTGQLQITLGRVDYQEVDSQTESVTNRSSTLQANGGINLTSAGDIKIEGSNLIADANNNESGDLNLAADGDVIIKEATDSENTQSEETVGSAELNFVVQNEFDQIVRVAERLDDAKDALKDAKKAYNQYKKDLNRQKDNLVQLEQDYENKIPGVSFADLADLREIVQDMEDDKDWHKAGLAAAALNLVTQTTALAQQITTAASSTGTYGFNAGLQLDIDATKTNTSTSQTTSLASYLAANNITITTGNDGKIEASSTLIQGSHLDATTGITINTGELNIAASKDTYESETDTEHGHITVSQTVYGAASGPSVNGSYDRSRDRARSTTYNNSTLNAQNISLTTTGDANLTGANVRAAEDLTADIGGDLLVESQQDRHSGTNNSLGISGGFSLGGPDGANNGKEIGTAHQNFGTNGDVTGVSGGVNASNGRYRSRETVLSSLTSGGTANINVGGHTQVNGAVIATTDDEGNDLGNLNLSTETFAYENLRNTNTSQQQSGGISTSIGFSGSNPADPNQQQAQDATGDNDLRLNNTNIAYSDQSTYQQSNTLATIGQGNFTIRDETNSDDIERLNRDTTQTDKDIADISRTTANIDVTIDTRLLTAEGREEIKQNFQDSYAFGEDIYRASTTLSDEQALGLLDFWGVLHNNAQATQLRNDLVRNPDNAHIIEGLTSGDGDKYNQAMADIGHLAQTQFGLELSDINLYDANATTSTSLGDNLFLDRQGGTVADANHAQYGNIFIDANGDKENQVNTLGHEIIEYQTLQNGGRNDVAQEARANAFGTQFSSRINQAVGGNLNSTGGSNFQQNLLVSQSVFSGTERANTVGNAQVNNRQFFTQEAAMLDRARLNIARDTRLNNQEREIAQLQLDAVACAAVSCSASIPHGDPRKEEFVKLETYGNQLSQQGITIDGVMENLAIDTEFQVGNGRSRRTVDGFTYNTGQRIGDNLSEEIGQYYDNATGAIRTIGDGAATVSLGAGTTALAALCPETGIACAGAVGGGYLTYEAMGAYQDSYQEMVTPYHGQIGEQVADSFSLDTHQGNRTGLDRLLGEVAIAGGEVVLGRIIGHASADSVTNQSRTVNGNRTDSGDIQTDSATRGDTTGTTETTELVADGQAFSGHGAITQNADGSLPTFVQPEGTSLTVITGNDRELWNNAGNLLEAGRVDDAIALQNDMDALTAPFAASSRNYNSTSGAQTYLPGSEVPDYTLYPPDNPPIDLLPGSITVDKPTNLSELINPNMGCMNWSACTTVLPPNNKVDLPDTDNATDAVRAPFRGTYNSTNSTQNSTLDVRLTSDDFSVKGSVPGDSKAFVRAEIPTSGTIEVTDIFRGNELPKGSGSDLLVQTLKGHNALPSDKLVFKNITNKETRALFKQGGNAEDSLLGKVGIKTLEKLNLKPTGMKFEVSRNQLNLVIDVEK